MNEVTRQITETIRLMVEDWNAHRDQGDTGLDADPLSPEIQLAGALLADLEAGRIECRRLP